MVNIYTIEQRTTFQMKKKKSKSSFINLNFMYFQRFIITDKRTQKQPRTLTLIISCKPL